MAIRAIATDSQDFNNPSTTGKPGRDERLDFKNEAGDTVFSIVSDADGTASIQGDAVPKVYRALLTQLVTNDPSATVLENTLGGDVEWLRAEAGSYEGYAPGLFAGTVPAQRFLLTGLNLEEGQPQGFLQKLDDDTVQLQTAGLPFEDYQDNLLIAQYIKISVYS